MACSEKDILLTRRLFYVKVSFKLAFDYQVPAVLKTFIPVVPKTHQITSTKLAINRRGIVF